MHEPDPALPVHPRNGLTALGFGRNGEPIWPILGGSGEDDTPPGTDDEPNDEKSTEDTDPDGDGDEGDPDGADQLGDAGKKALDVMKAKLKAERAKTRATKAELEKLRNGAAGKDGDGDAERIKREAEQSATAKANQRILRAEVKAAAAGKLADPSDAYKFLDLTAFEVDENGEVDADELAEAIDELVARKPYLGADTTKPPAKRFKGTGDGGPRGTGKRSLDQQIQDAENAGDWKAARRLKLQKLQQPNSK